MSYLRTYFILVSAIILLLPGAYGLDFSMGISNGIRGASESLGLNAGIDNAFASSTVASPDYYSTINKAEGPGELDFNMSFASGDGGEHVRLIAKMSDSVNHIHDFEIVNQANEEIRVYQSLQVNQGENIECSAQAWNSLGQSTKVGLKIPTGSLIRYSNQGNATDTSVSANQTAIVPSRTKFSVFSEAKREFSTQSSSSTLMSSRAIAAQTNTEVTATKSKTTSKLSILRPA
jgi:hypothetical protein